MLIAKQDMSYQGRRIKVGETFEATARDARVLIAIGRAAEHVQAEAAQEVPKEKTTLTYKRRDMKAEDAKASDR